MWISLRAYRPRVFFGAMTYVVLLSSSRTTFPHDAPTATSGGAPSSDAAPRQVTPVGSVPPERRVTYREQSLTAYEPFDADELWKCILIPPAPSLSPDEAVASLDVSPPAAGPLHHRVVAPTLDRATGNSDINTQKHESLNTFPRSREATPILPAYPTQPERITVHETWRDGTKDHDPQRAQLSSA